MGKIQRFPIGFPPIIREIIKQQVGTIGNSEAEVVKNIVLIYLTERNLINISKRQNKINRGEKK